MGEERGHLGENDVKYSEFIRFFCKINVSSVAKKVSKFTVINFFLSFLQNFVRIQNLSTFKKISKTCPV